MSDEGIELVVFNEKKLEPVLFEQSKLITMALENKHLDIIRLLFDEDGKINRKNHFGITHLISSIMSGKLHDVKLLIECHADISLKSSAGMTPLAHASFQYKNILLEKRTKEQNLMYEQILITLFEGGAGLLESYDGSYNSDDGSYNEGIFQYVKLIVKSEKGYITLESVEQIRKYHASLISCPYNKSENLRKARRTFNLALHYNNNLKPGLLPIFNSYRTHIHTMITLLALHKIEGNQINRLPVELILSTIYKESALSISRSTIKDSNFALFSAKKRETNERELLAAKNGHCSIF
jgi:ankyrin repeat protein